MNNGYERAKERCCPIALLLLCAAAFSGMVGAAGVQTVDKIAVRTPSIAQPEPLWRSVLNLESHRLGEEFDSFTANPPASLPKAQLNPFTLAMAITNARARLSLDASASAIAGLRSSSATRSVQSLQAAAIAAVVAGKPAAALAAWLAAYDKEPRNPSVLVNLAGLLARMGMPNEALALLDAADALGSAVPAPAGLKGQAVALNARGYALLLLRRWKEADAVLRKAFVLDPQLSEAARNLAYVLNQEADREEAKRFFFLGVWRVQPQTLVHSKAGNKSDTPSAPPADPFQSHITTRPSLADLIDLSGGRRGKLPTLPHPTDVRQIKNFTEMTQRLRTGLLAWCNAALQRQMTMQAQLSARPPWTKSPTERRSHHIDALLGLGGQADLSALFDRRRDAENALTAEASKVLKNLQPAYIAAAQIKDTNARRAREMAIANEGIALITPAWNRYDEAERNYFALVNWYNSGIASLQGDPLWHEKAIYAVQFEANRAYDRLLSNAATAFALAAGWGTGSVIEPKPVEEPEALENEDSPCGGGRAGAAIGISLSDTVSVSVNCKSIGIEVGTDGWIGAFASVEYEFEGRVTVFAGPKAELGIEGLGTKVGMKDGLYITVDRNGVPDVGARVAFESSTAISPGVSVATTIDSMDFSFVPSVPGL